MKNYKLNARKQNKKKTISYSFFLNSIIFFLLQWMLPIDFERTNRRCQKKYQLARISNSEADHLII